MKTLRFLSTLFAILLVTPLTYAQSGETITPNALFKELRKIENANYTNISSVMMTMARAMTSGDEKSFLENIKSMRIITFNDCSASDVEQVANRLRTIEFKDYEPGVTTTEGNTEMRVFIKTKGDEVKEIIIATLIENNVTLMQINGNLSIEDLEKLSKSNPIQQPTQ